MRIRSIVFWAHLLVGVLAGLVILMMSITGVLLTYERQLVAWAEDGYVAEHKETEPRLSVDELIGRAQKAEPDAERLTFILKNDPDAVVRVTAGRNRDLLIDPVTGDVLLQGQSATRKFFRTVMYVHRWFALSADSRATGRAITNTSNLLFLFLLCTGIYLWLPRVWSRAVLKTKVLFNGRAGSGKARDYNWHHVFSFWASIPLLIIIATATVFYYPWSNAMVYGAFGEQPPARGQGSSATRRLTDDAVPLSYAQLFSVVLEEGSARGIANWKSVSLEVPAAADADARFRIDQSIGGQPAKATRLTLDRESGDVSRWRIFADNTPGARARSTIRFLHTGEVFGVVGQSVAGIASLAACFLVWTGFALAWRRLVRPVLSRGLPEVSA